MKRLLILLLLLAGGCTPSAERVRQEADRCWAAGEWNEEAVRRHPEQLEERFGRWVGLLEQLPVEEAGPRLRTWLQEREGSAAGFQFAWELTEKYLYVPYSPLRDDELYAYALEEIVRSPQIDDYRKLRPRYQLNMVRRNRPGSPAADFALTLPDGTVQQLHDVKAPLTLLVFSDPECDDCRRMVRRLRRNGWIRLAELRKELKIDAVYSNPEELCESWEEYASTLPDRWLTARDEGARLHYKGLYDLRATPALYLLDPQKRVLVKGAVTLPPVTRQIRRALLPGRE